MAIECYNCAAAVVVDFKSVAGALELCMCMSVQRWQCLLIVVNLDLDLDLDLELVNGSSALRRQCDDIANDINNMHSVSHSFIE